MLSNACQIVEFELAYVEIDALDCRLLQIASVYSRQHRLVQAISCPLLLLLISFV